jgi:hypothetical protein
MEDVKITFFMLVTNRDVFIADYSIRSYMKLVKRGLSFKVLIYANCLGEEIRKFYFQKWQNFNFVEIIDNTDGVSTLKLKAGEIIVSPEGIKRMRDASCENYDELWTRELPKIKTPYYATVDADFEILQEEFVLAMLKELDKRDDVVAMSSDYTPTLKDHFDSYSNQVIELNERWNTWFCIYKQEAQRCKVSHFYYEEITPTGKKCVYDSAGYFQKKLKEEFGFKIESLDMKFQNQFIHYGAFSKNRTLNRRSIWLYRRLSILKKVGLLNWNSTILDWTLNRLVRIIAFKVLSYYYSSAEKERRVYNFNE